MNVRSSPVGRPRGRDMPDLLARITTVAARERSAGVVSSTTTRAGEIHGARRGLVLGRESEERYDPHLAATGGAQEREHFATNASRRCPRARSCARTRLIRAVQPLPGGAEGSRRPGGSCSAGFRDSTIRFPPARVGRAAERSCRFHRQTHHSKPRTPWASEGVMSSMNLNGRHPSLRCGADTPILDFWLSPGEVRPGPHRRATGGGLYSLRTMASQGRPRRYPTGHGQEPRVTFGPSSRT
jgi:hypothetical protein